MLIKVYAHYALYMPINEIRSAVYGLREKTLFMKLFKTNSIDHVKYCQHCFSFDMPSDLWQKRVKAFSEMYIGLP